jgi:predicted RNA-binding protein with PIN domain
MRLLIDGYNLLHTTMPSHLAGLDEAGLCGLLARSRWRGGAVVVCDGMPKPGLAAVSPVASVELVYSGVGRSADEHIIALIEAHSAPRRLAVVSNDREIQKAARRRRCRVLTCERMIGELAILAAASGSRPPEGGIGGGTDYWLRQFGLDGNAPLDPSEKKPWHQ